MIGGDRQATAGHMIAHRRMRKVYPSDRMSAVAVAGNRRAGVGDGAALLRGVGAL